jgi:hypothetical protein
MLVTFSFASQAQWDLGYQHKLSQLRNVQFFMHIFQEDLDNVLYLVSFFKAAPFIEKLEVHVCTLAGLYLMISLICFYVFILFPCHAISQTKSE